MSSEAVQGAGSRADDYDPRTSNWPDLMLLTKEPQSLDGVMKHGAMRLRRVSENDHAVSLGDLDAFTPITQAGGAKGRLRYPSDLVR